MEKIVIAGPFSPSMREALEVAIPLYFEKCYIQDITEYPLLKDADYIILRTLSLKADDIDALTRTKLIQRWGVGFDTVDIATAGAKGIQVAVTFGTNAVPVAEMTLALTLAVFRNLASGTASIMKGIWNREELGKRSYTINGKKVGLYGMGTIGRKVAALFVAFGAQVVYYDPYPLSQTQEEVLQVKLVSQEEVFATDIVSLHAPLTESTRQVINAKSLCGFKDKAILINTAREELTDLTAVAHALRSGKLLGAGFDAIEESIIHQNPFAGIDTVVLSAHLGGNTVDNAIQMANRCAQQILAVSQGIRLAPPALVNGQYLR